MEKAHRCRVVPVRFPSVVNHCSVLRRERNDDIDTYATAYQVDGWRRDRSRRNRQEAWHIAYDGGQVRQYGGSVTRPRAAAGSRSRVARYADAIEGWFLDDLRMPRKQRHTVKRWHEEHRTEGEGLCLSNLCSALWSRFFRTCGGSFRHGSRNSSMLELRRVPVIADLTISNSPTIL